MQKGTFGFLVLLITLTSLSFSPAYLAKGRVVWTQVVHLNAEEAGTASNSKGLLILKLTSDMQLTYKIIVQKIDEGDMLMNAHIHLGEAGASGPAIIDLSPGVMSLGKFQTLQLFPKQYYYLLNNQRDEALYVNVHTMLYPDGSVRGQIAY